MAYTSPATWTGGQLVGATDLNTQLRDNMLWLGGTTGQITQSVSASGVSSGPTTTTVGYTDLTDMAVTLTTTGGDLLCFLQCELSTSSTVAINSLAFSVDAAAEQGVAESILAGTSERRTVFIMTKVTAPSVASHTIKGRWAASAGTLTAVNILRQLLVIELKR